MNGWLVAWSGLPGLPYGENYYVITDLYRALRLWLRAYARKHERWSYRRAYVQARNDRWVVNHKKIQRLWGKEDLRVVVKRRHKRTGVSDLPTITKVVPHEMCGRLISAAA